MIGINESLKDFKIQFKQYNVPKSFHIRGFINEQSREMSKTSSTSNEYIIVFRIRMLGCF